MSCKKTGTSNYDCDFVSHSGRSVHNEECTIAKNSTGVKHYVIVSPVRKKFTSIRVTGRIDAESATAKAKFAGPLVSINGIEWIETKRISTVDIIFDSSEITHAANGSENIGTKVEEYDRFSRVYNQIDQNDLTFTVTLS
jgi:hypothetical protein